MSQHRAELRSLRSRISLRAILVTLAACAAATILAVSTTGGTYALMSSSVTINAGTISTGTATLTINDQANATITGLDVTQLLPGRSVMTATPLTLKNTGTVPLRVTMGTVGSFVGSTDLTSKLKFAVIQSATCTIGADGAAFPTSAPFTIEVGQSLPVCIQVGLDSSADAVVQGQTATFTIPLSGLQVRS
jgi:hypothetical protein